jgi:ABC-2 type transport system permease protein
MAPSVAYAQRMVRDSGSADAVLYIPARETTIPNDAFLYYQDKVPSSELQSDISSQLQNRIRNIILQDVHGISEEEFESINAQSLKLHTKSLETGKQAFVEIKTVVGLVFGMVIFFVIFMFGASVMRGVAEEKTSRIVEVIVSSVKPFQLMMGKVVGIGLVGLTQFILWLLLSMVGMLGVRATNPTLFEQAESRQTISEIATKGEDLMEQTSEPVSELMQGLVAIDFSLIIPMFLIYFLLGYFFYATLFAAVGSLVDSDSDGQQFTLPLTLPLMLVMLLMPAIIKAPSGDLAMALSLIPFTSPVAMMIRLPFGVPIWQAILSIALLALSFPINTWIAARIYRRGILSYGRRLTYKDLLGFLKTKN